MDTIPSAAARSQGGVSNLSDRDESNLPTADHVHPRAPPILSFSANLGIALATVFLGYAAMLYYGAEGSSLHTMLDTSVALIAALIALLLWDMSRKSETRRPLFLTITFAMLAVGELMHVVAVLATPWEGEAEVWLRAGTWGPPACLLPIGLGASLLVSKLPRSYGWLFTFGLTLVAIILVVIFLSVPRYTAPGFLGISRPSLIFVPLLWMAVGAAYWKRGRESEIARAIAVTAVVFVMGHIAMLYSRAPSDTPAMLAHFDKVVAEVLLLFNLTQIGIADTVRRRQVEQQLTDLNRDLDTRVAERTAQLQESNERVRLIVDTALDAVIGIDQTGAITAWNPQAETIFGWASQEALGGLVDQFVMPEPFREAHREGLARYLATGEAKVLNKRIELAALHRDGHEFPVELAITPLRAGGTVTFSAFVRDITDRKLAETKLQAQVGRLNLLNQITRAIGRRQDMGSIFQVVVRSLEDQLPADFCCIGLHDRFGHSLVVEHVGATGATTARGLDIATGTGIAIDQNGLARAVKGDVVYEPDLAAIDFPFPNRLARQGLRSLVLAPLPIEGEVFGLLVVARFQDNAFVSGDCEFLKQLGEHVGLAAHQAQLRGRLQEAYDDLKQTQEAVLAQERMRAIGQMASGIAHDINNAISPVAIYTQSLLEREPDLTPEVHDYLEIVGRVIKDVSATVSRMRDFYRPKDRALDFEPLQLNELVPQVVNLTRARWSDMPQRRGVVITVSTMLETDLPLVLGNASELREAMTNLIFNAVDAMPDGGSITVRTETIRSMPGHERRVLLEVADSGCGMNEEARRRCLEPFFTTKDERGTGLGLAMVYGAAQRHKAVLDIDSAPGKGTRIWLEFAAGEIRRAQEQPRVPHEVRPLRLLIVDDDPSVLRSTVFVLKLDGHDMTAVDGGLAAIDALLTAHAAGKPFDLVITDLGMPYVDGNQVAAKAKELFPTTPILLMTGWGRRMDGEPEAPRYIDFVLPKPPDLEDLRAIFAKVSSSSAA
jgi:PAS domain S-box-containing protein